MCAASCGKTEVTSDATATAADSRSSADASATYEPCPIGDPCRYMPLGDSLTEGYLGGYRVPLFHQVMQAGRTITFVGMQMNGPETVDGVAFPPNHEGHGGYYIDSTHSQYNIADLANATIAANQPHIIALMIGTNDVSRSMFPDSAERLALLLDQLTVAAPNALVVLAQIPPTQTDATNVYVEAYNAAMPAMVAARVAQGKHIVLVDMYTAFAAVPSYQSTLFVDNFHPNASGDAILAEVFYTAVGPVLH